MRIDPKYFNTFLLVVALVAAALIAYFIFSNRTAERTDFTQRMFDQDSLQTVWWPRVQTDDSLQVSNYDGKVVVLDLWSNWSDASLNSHRELSEIQQKHSNDLEVIAAAVGVTKEEAISYMEEHEFPFHFVAGSQHFSSFNMPGLPVQFIYNSETELKHVFLGYSDESQYDSLKVLLNDESP
ncbi:MAG: TlpA family protein disulfide reductase [Bacteroidota bacterium]